MRRRRFLRNAGVAGAGVLGAPALLRGIGRSAAPLGVGIIGTGDRGSGLLQLVNDLDDLEAVALCDVIDFRLAEAVAATDGRAAAYTDHRALLDDPRVEVVLLATPFGMHGPMALDALAAGKHLYCEKTMARGEADIAAVVAAAEAHPELTFQTGHQYHSSALYREVKRQIDAGYLGELTKVQCQWHRNHDWRRPVPPDRPELEPLINWRMYREYSGGMVAELMSHQLDFVNWITGEHPARISGQGGIDHYHDGRETYDNVHLQCEYPSGLDATFSCTTTNRFGDYQIRVLGREATVVLGYDWAKVYAESTEPAELGVVDGVTGATITAWSRGEGVFIEADGAEATRQALVEFRDCIRAGTQPESDVHTGALAARCVDLGLRAALGHTTLEWA